MRTAKNNFYWLAAAIFVLWSIGRVVNPTLRAFVRAGHTPEMFTLVVGAYAFLHAAVFVYTLWLLVQTLRTPGYKLTSVLLYVYVLAALVLSLGFVAYDFGYLPDFVRDALPYPFNVEVR